MPFVRPAKLVKMEVVYSDQAMKIISQLKDFNFDEFENFYLGKILVGDRSIQEYLLLREVK